MTKSYHILCGRINPYELDETLIQEAITKQATLEVPEVLNIRSPMINSHSFYVPTFITLKNPGAGIDQLILSEKAMIDYLKTINEREWKKPHLKVIEKDLNYALERGITRRHRSEGHIYSSNSLEYQILSQHLIQHISRI